MGSADRHVVGTPSLGRLRIVATPRVGRFYVATQPFRRGHYAAGHDHRTGNPPPCSRRRRRPAGGRDRRHPRRRLRGTRRGWGSPGCPSRASPGVLGSARPPLYRRWKSSWRWADPVAAVAAQGMPAPATGSLYGDVRAVLELAAYALRHPVASQEDLTCWSRRPAIRRSPRRSRQPSSTSSRASPPWSCGRRWPGGTAGGKRSGPGTRSHRRPAAARRRPGRAAPGLPRRAGRLGGGRPPVHRLTRQRDRQPAPSPAPRPCAG
ncbi:hypothetical protein SBADM41S_04053 [Streptomyces badius]